MIGPRTLRGLWLALLLAWIGAPTLARSEETMPAPTPDPGLQLRLKEAPRDEAPLRPLARPEARPLDEARTGQILRRLPELRPASEGPEGARLRPGSQPPPRAGEVRREPFPPPPSPAPAPPAGEAAPPPLALLRRAPEGHLSDPRAQLTVTFSQPMVALSSQGEAATSAPVRLEPQPAGRWRWIGTRTLSFEPQGRFPMATRYQVEVPAGTRAASGARLARAERWEFTTPPPTLEEGWPEGGSQPLDPILLLRFDQAIDPAALLARALLRGGSAEASLRLASPEEVAADPATAARVRRWAPGRWVALRAERPLPGGTPFALVLPPGTPSAEGPRATTEAQTLRFETRHPLRLLPVEEARPLLPSEPWRFRFNNPLADPASLTSLVRIQPPVEDLKAAVEGDRLTLRVRSRARTRYQVTFAPQLADVHGQRLGAPASATVQVGPPEPHLIQAGGPLAVIEPQATPSWSVFSLGHARLKIRLHRVTPADWEAWEAWRREAWREDPPPLPGAPIPTGPIQVATPDLLTEVRVDLSPALEGGLGHALVTVEAEGPEEPPGRRRGPRTPPVAAWVQVTRIGLTALADSGSVAVMASTLSEGRPLQGVELRLGPGGGPIASTGPGGLATLPLPATPASLLIATQGADTALLPAGGSGWRRRPQEDEILWHVLDDRGLYRPGETARVKGWVRRLGAGPRGDLLPLGPGPLDQVRIRWELQDARSNRVEAGETGLTPAGGFDLALRLPETMHLGQAELELELVLPEGWPEASMARASHELEIQEFRRPEFEVTSRTSPGPHLVGETAVVSVKAGYFAGGGLPDAEVQWTVDSEPGEFQPPGWDEFTFGTWTPWWLPGLPDPGDPAPSDREERFTGRTDRSGGHGLALELLSITPPQPMVVEATAEIADLNRQAWSASSLLLVHPSLHYVGLKSGRAFIQAGEDLELEAVVTDLDGQALAGRPIQLRWARIDRDLVAGRPTRSEEEVHEQTVRSVAGPSPVRFRPDRPGAWELTATIRDDQGRPNQARRTVWVAGEALPPDRGVKTEAIRLIPDRPRYEPGEVAEILVLSPLSPAEGILTLERGGLLETIPISVAGPSHALKVPIPPGTAPNLHLQVDLVGRQPRQGAEGSSRPAEAQGRLELEVSPRARALEVQVRPGQPELEPGGQTSLTVRVQGAEGEPVAGAEVALIVVDEAILALSGARLEDPLASFYPRRPPGVLSRSLRPLLQLDGAAPELAGDRAILFKTRGGPPRLAPPAPLAAEAEAVGASPEGEGDGQGAPLRVRADFNPLAMFEARVVTDRAGQAAVDLKLPDNLTRYRIMAVAVEGERRFGRGEGALTARLPLMVRPSPPRFLNFGDRAELPVMLQNQTAQPMEVELALQTSNLALEGAAGRRIRIPAQDRVEVRFPVSTLRAGEAAFQVGAMAGPHLDAAEGRFPVWTPATAEAFATYGHLDGGAVVQQISAPGEVSPLVGGLEVTTSATALQELTDAVLYLRDYPFDCAEQVASRLLAVAALGDALEATSTQGLATPAEIQQAVARDLERLLGLQREDGGFGLWRRDDQEIPFISLHAAHALVRVRLAGFPVPDEPWRRSLERLRRIEAHLPEACPGPIRASLQAYALRVLELAGEPDPVAARRLVQSAGGIERLPLEALGWLLPTLSQAGAPELPAARRALLNRVEETAGAARFATPREEDGWLILRSDRRTDGILLEAMIQDQPDSDLVPKLVRGLLDHRTRGRWASTQENAFALLALGRAFRAYEATPPDLTARLWLGEAFAGAQRFQGRANVSRELTVPMRWLADRGPQALVLAHEGRGRLYYRLGMRYAPMDLSLAPADHGFSVERTYEPLDRPEDVRRDPDGTWRIRAGARVGVRVLLRNPGRRTHVALVDPLPAGLEPLNPALEASAPAPAPARVPSQPWSVSWFQHQNLRDERAEAFTSLLWPGTHEYAYAARATTPGRFIVPPARAEEMYAPETFGRSGTDRVIVE